MRIVFYLLIITAISCKIQAQEKVERQYSYFENGNVSEIRKMTKDGQKTGLWTKFYSSGNIKEVVNYQDNLLNGSFQYYDDTSVKHRIFEGGYLNGKRSGLWKEYYPEEKLKKEYTYVNDTLNGILKTYDEKTGEINSKGNYLKGTPHGLWTFYYPSTSKMVEQTYANGIVNGPYRSFKNSKVEFEGQYLNEKKDGLWKYKELNNTYDAHINFRNGIADGEVIAFSYGNKELMFTIEKGKLTGKIGVFGSSKADGLYLIGEADEYELLFHKMISDKGEYDISDNRNEQYYRNYTKAIKEVFELIPKS